MISRIRSALLLLVSTALVTALAQEKPKDAAAGDGPKLALASPNHDFGDVKSGTPLTYSFKFHNEGKSDLQIMNVAPG